MNYSRVQNISEGGNKRVGTKFQSLPTFFNKYCVMPNKREVRDFLLRIDQLLFWTPE